MLSSCGARDAAREANLQQARHVQGLAALKSELEATLRQLPFVQDARIALGETASGRTIVAEVVPRASEVGRSAIRARIITIASSLAEAPESNIRVIFVASVE